MNRSQILLSLILRAAEVPCSVTDFSSRLTVQKAVYLLQQAGIEMGYPYSWYIRGPYSTRLAEDLFYVSDLEADEAKEIQLYTLGEKTRKVVERTKRLLAFGKTAPKRARCLELLASVLFLIRTGQAKSTETSKLSDILKANKKIFESADTQRAVELLKEYGYQV